MHINAVLLAGGQMSPNDPLYSQAPGGSRCLMDIQGKPMVQWVIDALDQASSIREIYVVGLNENAELTANKPLHYVTDQGSLFDNIHQGVLRASDDHPDQTSVMVASGDIPAIKPEMVDWLAGEVVRSPGFMIYYNVIPQSVMEARFPKANRSFVRFRDIAVCGGDLNVVDRSLFDAEQPIWNKLAEARKNPIKQVSYLGFGNLILVALRLVTLDGAVKRVCKKLNIRGKALICPHAEMAMDADKPHQLEILREDLGSRL